MRTRTRSSIAHATPMDEQYFERKSLELVVAEEEIEAWELDAQDLDEFTSRDDCDGRSSYE